METLYQRAFSLFPNGKVATDRLGVEIASSSITKAVSRIDTLAEDCMIWFRDALSSGEESTLDSIISTHQGGSLVSDPVLVTLDSPRELDKKPIVVISPAMEGFTSWLTGAADNPDAIYPDTGRGTGKPFLIEFTAQQVIDGGSAGHTIIEEFSFIEPLEVHDGQIVWRELINWSHLDKYSFGVRLPATVVVANGTNTGNCNKVAIPNTGGTMNVIVPAAGDGAYDVDLATAVPVPAMDKDGYWDVTLLSGAVSMSTTPGSSPWHLFDFDIMTYLLRNIMMTHPMGVFDIDVYKSEYFHKNWKLVWSVTKKTPGAGVVSGWIFCFRRHAQ